MKLKLSEIKNVEPRREHGNIKELAESIKKEGLLQPLVINQDNELICGRRRFEAVKFLGLEEVETYQIETKNDIDKLSKAIVENIMRLNLTWQEEVKAKEELDQLMREKYGSVKERERTDLTASDSEPDKWSQEKTAEQLNQSTGLVSEDIQLSKELKKRPELAKCKTKSEAKKILKREKRDEHLIIKPLPEGLYEVILADPPYRYEFSETKSREIENKYPSMDLEDIKNIKVPANENAILFLWSPAPKVEEAIEIINAWNFKYRTCAIWDKKIIGMGYWFRIQHELLLVAIKGNFKTPKPEDRFPSVIYKKRTKHSKKPDIVYDMIETMFPDKKKLELFARQKYNNNWKPWGNEIL